MLTHGYKGGYIHGKFDTDKVTYQLPGDYVVYHAKSMHAAKILITNWIKANVKA